MEYTDDDLLNWIDRLADGDAPPSTSEMRESDGPCINTYHLRFDSYLEAVRKAGYDPYHNRPRKYTDEDLLEWVNKLTDGDTPPTQADMTASDGPCISTFQSRFKSWSDAIKKAGYHPPHSGRKYDDKELLEWIHDLADDDIPPSAGEMDASEGPITETFAEHFGSWTAALKKAGYEPYEPADSYSDNELLTWIERLSDGDTPPTYRQINDAGGPSSGAYRAHFGSWDDALKEAGYEPTARQQSPQTP